MATRRRRMRRSVAGSQVAPISTVASASATSTWPRVTRFSPLAARSSVDFPDPDSPMSTEISPRATASEAAATGNSYSVKPSASAPREAAGIVPAGPTMGMVSGGVLQEPCESRRAACAGYSYNITVFKGMLDRTVRDWSEATRSVAFDWFLEAQARAVIAHAASNGKKRTGCQTPRSCVLGMYWARSISPTRQPKLPNAGSQAAGLEALTSGLVVGASYPAFAGA